ncbi:hypothetical protein M0804_014763 [Polistes exclamans]|nr:hypothetical protein M0804_014763 [Polistes exclamans]
MIKLQIVCKNWRTWEIFDIKGGLSNKMLQSLSFENCGLPNGISLKNVVKKLGITETHTLIFKSFKNLFATLKREHLPGFGSVKSLVLSNNGLFHICNDLILDFPELEHIDLSNNDIDLPVDIFKATPNLKQIILSSSGIDMIPVRTFNNLTNLEYLNIMSNHLEKFEAGIFDQLVSLTSLNLANNLFSVLPLSIFHGLKNLKKLDISMNYFTYIPANLFNQNKELRELYLNSNFKQIITLPDSLLANLTKLQHVHLNNNGFISLPESLFWGSSSLEYIFLNDNFLVTLPQNIFRGLNKVVKLSIKNNKIEILPDEIFKDMEKLKVLDLSNNRMVHVSKNLFLGMDSLYELNLERNQLNSIHKNGLAPLLNLQIARLSNNPLKLFFVNGILSIFNTNQYLEELYLSNSSIDYFFDDWLNGNNNLRVLDLSHNFISNVKVSSFILPSHEITIDLSYNKIRNIHFDKIEEIVAWRTENRNTVINLEHNPLLCDCPLYDLLRYRERKMSPRVHKYFNIKFKNLTCVQPDGKKEIEISNLHSSTYKCLEHEYFKTEKRCQNDCTCNVRLLDKTRILDCSYKNMSEFLIDKSKVIFERDNPFILNLTGNFLTEIPSIEPLYPINVTGLLLSNNNISTITLDKLPYSLKVLELHNNNISSIYFEELSYLTSISLEKFTLSRNPIICDCDNQNLVEFLQSQRVYYEDLDNLICMDTHLPMHQIPIEEMFIFLITFTTINTSPCKENPTCECSPNKLGELNIVCNVDNSTWYNVNIKSMKNVQIVCKNWRTWEDFYIKGRLTKKMIQSLSFEKCGLSNETSLINVVRQLGVRDTHTLIFKSFKNLLGKLRREHLRGFQSVKSLVLSDNGLIDISYDLILDFPELEHIDLSNNNIILPVDIFDGTIKLKRLTLISSGLDIIPAGTFYMLANLQFLNVMSNNLEKLEDGIFDQLVSLKSLNLANNLLSQLPSTIFHLLKNLQTLDISMNNFSFFPQELFDQNKELRELYLDSNFKQISTLPDNFLANLTKLQHVHLDNNKFIFLPENLFWGSSSLEYISLNDNSLVTLPRNIFQGLINVKKLLIRQNKIESLPNKIFKDMERLELLDLSNNRMTRVSRNLFRGMISLYELNMKRNQIKFIHKEGLAPLKNLRIARFAHNPLKLPNVNGKLSVFYSNQNLEELFLSNTSIYHFSEDWFSGNDNLRLLNLSHNNISNITASSFTLSSHEISIDLRYNEITNIFFDQFEEKVYLRKENSKVFIRLAHNPISCGCPLYDLLRYLERRMSPRVYDYYFLKLGNLTCVQPNGKNEIEISKLKSSTYECLEHEYLKTENICENDFIFLITFTTINTTPCQTNPKCECSSIKSEEFNIVCNVDNSTGYNVNIKSRNNVQIICKNWRTWEDFYIKGRLSEKILQTLSFEKCGLPTGMSLKDVVKQLGVRDTHTLIFKSFKNLFGRLRREHLTGFKNVKSLVLSDNGLIDITNDLFFNFPELENMELSNNNLDLPVDIFDHTPNLRQLVLISSGIDILPLGIFYTLTKLEFLDIMSNNLENIDADLFNQLVSLTNLNLANNFFSELPPTIFYELKNLEWLDISTNNFSSFPQKLLDQNKKLKLLYLESNLQKISTLPENFLANLTNLSGVQLNNNGISSLPENLFWGSSALQYIFLNDNSLVTLPKRIFRGLGQVRKLSIRNNKIETLPDKIFEDMEELGILDLSDNQIARLSKNLFLGMDSLYELNMERNQLKFIYTDSLIPLKNLQIARLSHNPLKLPNIEGKLSVFYTNQDLEELYLSNTSINSFFDDWSSGNNNLKLLNLSHNAISNITFEEKVALIKEKHRIVIHMEYNPLICGCPLYDLLRYREGKMSPLVHNYFNIKLKNLTCVQLDGKYEKEISKLKSSTYECLEHEYFNTENKCPKNCRCYIRLSDKFPPLLLCNNNISTITADKLPTSLKIMEKIILSGNIIMCDCNNENLIEFVKLNGAYFKDLDNLTCEDTNFSMDQQTIDELCPSYLEFSEFLLCNVFILIAVVFKGLHAAVYSNRQANISQSFATVTEM